MIIKENPFLNRRKPKSLAPGLVIEDVEEDKGSASNSSNESSSSTSSLESDFLPSEFDHGDSLEV